MWFDRLHQGSTGCIGGDSGHLVGWVYGGLGLHLGVVGDDGERWGKVGVRTSEMMV